MGKEKDVEYKVVEAPVEEVMDLIASKQELADYLKMHLTTLEKLLAKYPFELSGKPGKIMGRWRVPKTDVNAWFRYVQAQEMRHPAARRMRPHEPPEITEIAGR